MEPLNILHINSNYLTSKLHENLIDKLENNGINNQIFMPMKKEKEDEIIYKSDHDVMNPIVFKDIDKVFFYRKQNKIYTALEKHVSISDFNVVHAHTMSTDGNIAYKIYKNYGTPYMLTFRGYTDLRFFKLRVHLRKRGVDILKNASVIVFLSDSSRDELFNRFIKNEDLKYKLLKKSIILPNGIDSYWHENKSNDDRKLDSNLINVITVGKVIKLKNLLNTVKALKIIQNQTDYKFKLTSVGKIIDKKYAEQCVKEAENTLDLELLGNKSREDLLELYRNNDIFLMPSFKETFGLVYPEAISQGLPVIYSKSQGFDKQFPEGRVGYSVNPKNYEDIAEKTLKIVEDYETISKDISKNISKFDWSKLSEIYAKLYSTIK